MYAFVLISRDFSFLYFLHQEEIMNEWMNAKADTGPARRAPPPPFWKKITGLFL